MKERRGENKRKGKRRRRSNEERAGEKAVLNTLPS